MVKVYAVGHKVVLEGRTVVVQLPVGVGAFVHGKAADVEVLLVLLLDFLVRQQHLGIHLRLILTGFSHAAQLHAEHLALLLLQVSQETQLVSRSVTVQVVHLTGNFQAVQSDECRFHFTQGLQVNNHRLCLQLKFRRVLNCNRFLRLCRCYDDTRQQQGQRNDSLLHFFVCFNP